MRCDECSGSDTIPCALCKGGRLKRQCQMCVGTGQEPQPHPAGGIVLGPCPQCLGSGRLPCPECDGANQMTCRQCRGKGILGDRTSRATQQASAGELRVANLAAVAEEGLVRLREGSFAEASQFLDAYLAECRLPSSYDLARAGVERRPLRGSLTSIGFWTIKVSGVREKFPDLTPFTVMMLFYAGISAEQSSDRARADSHYRRFLELEPLLSAQDNDDRNMLDEARNAATERLKKPRKW